MNERTNDLIDHACQIEEQIRAGEIQAVRNNAARETHPDFDGEHCVEEACGVLLPPKRVALGRIRCVECQERIELAERQYRR